jgi:hypothetical protein
VIPPADWDYEQELRDCKAQAKREAELAQLEPGASERYPARKAAR